MGDDEALERALEVRARVIGERTPHRLEAGEPPEAMELRDLWFEHTFVDAWGRPGLASETKSLITIAIMVSLGTLEELRAHIKGALRLGITKSELIELFIHTTAYCGAPRTSAAYRIALDVFAETPSTGD